MDIKGFSWVIFPKISKRIQVCSEGNFRKENKTNVPMILFFTNEGTNRQRNERTKDERNGQDSNRRPRRNKTERFIHYTTEDLMDMKLQILIIKNMSKKIK